MHRSLIAALTLLWATGAQAQLLDFKSGHLKGQYLLGTYPDDSLVRELIGTPSQDLNADLRLLVHGYKNQWSWQADYQLVLRSGDTVELGRGMGGSLLRPGASLNDDHRLMDLTDIISEDDDSVLLQRLDRLHAGYAGDKAVLRVGRQAVSWGNGLIYNPVDFFNPFDPAAVDKEYKTGDDMIYGQYLQDSGNDWQFVSVWRRDENGNTDPDVNSNALKYHAFIGEREVDGLLARHFEDEIASLGGISNWGGAILRGDLMITHTDLDTYTSLVTNLSYSWTWGGKNMSGAAEYFYNGLGLQEKDYDKLASSYDLTVRLARGELFTIGRHYLAGGVTVEMTPLFNLTPNLFYNLGDSSGLFQLSAIYDVSQSWQLLLAANLPFGADGTEFGGLDSGVDNLRLSSGPSLFAQLAFYF
jgi:hypothetical protein